MQYVKRAEGVDAYQWDGTADQAERLVLQSGFAGCLVIRDPSRRHRPTVGIEIHSSDGSDGINENLTHLVIEISSTEAVKLMPGDYLVYEGDKPFVMKQKDFEAKYKPAGPGIRIYSDNPWPFLSRWETADELTRRVNRDHGKFTV